MSEQGVVTTKDEHDGDDELTKKINEEAENLANVKVDEDDWAEDVSPEAVLKRKEEEEKGLSEKLFAPDDELESPYETFGNQFIDKIDALDEDLIRVAKELEIFGNHKATQVLIQVIFNEDIVKQIPKRSKLLKKVYILMMFSLPRMKKT